MSDSSVERLNEIQAELSGILEARLTELSRALRESEVLTRRIIAAEFDIDRQQDSVKRLQAEMDTLETEVETVRAQADDVRARHDTLSAERVRLRNELDHLDRDVREADAENHATRHQVGQLEAEGEALRGENGVLKTKLRTLEENIARMRRLKEELMSSITGLTAQMSGLAGGNE